jgi:short subunit dehydrogenase-like uncharacterized protein
VAALDVVTAVINCDGPFGHLGLAEARAALAAGSHYLDTSGEQRHVHQVHDLQRQAVAAGVAQVPAATDGGVPGDLLAHLIGDRLGPLADLTVAHLLEGTGAMSRGSLRSLLASADDLASGGLRHSAGGWQPAGGPVRSLLTVPGRQDPVPVVRFPLPEVVSIPRHVTVDEVDGAVAAATLDALAGGLPGEDDIDSLPEGPTPAQRAGGRFTVAVIGHGIDGGAATALAEGADTYGTTAVIAAACALRLAEGPPRSGVLAPAQAFEPRELLDSLATVGLSWRIEARRRQPVGSLWWGPTSRHRAGPPPSTPPRPTAG